MSADAWYALVKAGFAAIPDHRGAHATLPLVDALLSAFALFTRHDPALLAFAARRNDANLKGLFGRGPIPRDTRLRELLDPVDPEQLRPLFRDVFRQLPRGKALEPFVFYEGCALLCLEGTGSFSSQQLHGPAGLEKVNHQTGAVTYQHQRLGAALVPPDPQEVLPLAPEPIQKQEGSTKNACERNAAKRLLPKIRADHPRVGLIVVEDGLASTGPHVRALLDQRRHF